MAYSYRLCALVLLWCVHYSTSTVDDDNYREFFFNSYPGSMLSIPLNMNNVTHKSTKVLDRIECIFVCIGLPWCFSANFKTTPESYNVHLCQVFSVDQYSHEKYMTKNESFAHLSLKNICKDACQNNATCLPARDGSFRCVCAKGFHGKTCREDWLSINISGCGSFRKADSLSGDLMSPGFPQNYNSNLKCSWHLSSSLNIIFVLTFTSFATESTYDKVTVYDGGSPSATSLGVFSGTSVPPVMTSTSSQMYITFVTDGSNVNTGFSARYQGNFP